MEEELGQVADSDVLVLETHGHLADVALHLERNYKSIIVLSSYHERAYGSDTLCNGA